MNLKRALHVYREDEDSVRTRLLKESFSETLRKAENERRERWVMFWLGVAGVFCGIGIFFLGVQP